MNEKEIAISLVRNGIAKQRSSPNEYTEANEDESIRSLGNATIANSLEFLGKHGVVSDVQPTFSHRGIGFAYRISQPLVEELSND